MKIWEERITDDIIDAYLSYNHEDNTFSISDVPDYETAEHLPFRSPEEYDKWQEEND